MVNVATGAMASLLPKLEKLLEHKQLHRSVKEDAEQLLRELTSMHAALGSGFDPRWAGDCRELSYHIEDIVDAFLASTEPAARPDSFLGFLTNLLSPRRRIANAVKDIKGQVLNLAEKYTTTDKLVPAATTTTGPLAAHPRQEAEEPLVGVERVRDTLLESLSGGGGDASKQHMKIVSLVGSGGLGKTALANLVCRQLRPRFDSCAFVSVSSMPDMEGIFEQMLRQLNVENHHNKEAKDAIREFLQNKRYLIIVDDLWRKEDWHVLSRSLPVNDYGSRVIVTTQVNDVAKICCSGHDELICEIKHLDHLNSKILFLQRCFGSEASCPDAALAREIGEILEICGGIPSAIISIALLLKSEIAKRKPWQDEEFAFCSVWKQMASSLRSAQERIPGLEDLIKVLSLSYENLPSTLKTCLLYIATCTTVKCQLFERGDTVRKWIAEGFISQVGWRSREEVANQCFDDLIGSKVIQRVECPTFYGEMYEVNCMMLYILRLISREEKLVTFLSDLNISETPAVRPVFLSIRRCGSGGSSGTERLDLSHVRSITMIRCAKVFSFNRLGYLRVLDVDDCHGFDDTDVQYICGMILLKHLTLKQTPQAVAAPP